MQSAGELFAEWIDKRFDGSQAKAAVSLKISEAYVSMMKAGRRSPGRDLAVRLQELTGIPVTAWSSKSLNKSKKSRKLKGRNSQSSQGVNLHA